jgi:RNase H-fold protein (predicted Holliday junction resolvase)
MEARPSTLDLYDKIAAQIDSFLVLKLPSSRESRWYRLLRLSMSTTSESLDSREAIDVSISDPGTGSITVTALSDLERAVSGVEEYRASMSRMEHVLPDFDAAERSNIPRAASPSLSSTMKTVDLPEREARSCSASSRPKLIFVPTRSVADGYFRVNEICVVTSKPNAYYSLVSRLRESGIPYMSAVPGRRVQPCRLVLTTREESKELEGRVAAIEDLDADPGVFKGQIASLLDSGTQTMVVGVDPGKRIGMAVMYGETLLAFGTLDSVAATSARIADFALKVPSKAFVVRIGNGSPLVTSKLVQRLEETIVRVQVELVDESGTSVRAPRLPGMKIDESSASMIALRKGKVIRPVRPRTDLRRA